MFSVDAGGPAGQAGLSEGDEVHYFDGVHVGYASREHVASLFQQGKGRPITLLVKQATTKL